MGHPSMVLGLLHFLPVCPSFEFANSIVLTLRPSENGYERASRLTMRRIMAT
jgi:hypothetical protein